MITDINDGGGRIAGVGCAECGTRHWSYYVKCRGDKTVYWLARAFPTFPTEILRMIMREWYC